MAADLPSSAHTSPLFRLTPSTTLADCGSPCSSWLSTSTMSIYTPPSDSQGESRKMKLFYFSNEFPHDDLQDLLRRLHNHSKDRRHTILASFIDEATLAIRDEVRRLPTALKALIPPFETVLNFAEHAELRKGPLSGSIDGLLLCVVELATIIGYVEPTLLSGIRYSLILPPDTMRLVLTNLTSIPAAHVPLLWASDY